MATILLCVIYITFISLGIPDSLLGTAWPSMYLEMNVPISMAGFVSFTITCGTIISSLFAPKLIVRFGTKNVTAFSTLLCALSLLGFSFAPGYAWLILLAIPLGFGGGAIDIGLNDYVALHYSAAQMNLLHAFWGIGVSISPYLMSQALGKYQSWRHGYRLSATAELTIALIVFVTLPLWNKVKEVSTEEETVQRVASFSELFQNKYVRCVWFMMITSCAIESACGVWGSTYIVNAKGMPAETAALFAMCYCVGLTCGRIVAGIISMKLSSWKIMIFGMCFVGTALVILILPLPSYCAIIGLFLLGFGNGPVVPNLNHLTPRLFGQDICGSVIASQMTASYIGILGAPPIFGFIGQVFGMHLFPIYLALFFLLFIFSMKYLSACIKETGNQ